MHFILYELASNPEAQSKLRQEVKKAFDENNGSISYEQLQNLSYLDAVFNGINCKRLIFSIELMSIF